MTIISLNRLLAAFVLCFSWPVWASAPGTLDSSFGGDGKLTTEVGADYSIANAVIQQANDKLVVAGVSREASTDDFMLVRYNNDGSLDTSFNKTGKRAFNIGSGEDTAYALIQQSDNKLVAMGRSYQAGTDDFAVLRVTTAGELDKSFSGDGLAITPIGKKNDGAYAALQQGDGMLVAAGYSESTEQGMDFALARYTLSGELDKTFDTDGILTTDLGQKKNDEAYALLKQNDGKLLALGYSNNGTNDDFAIVRYNKNGSLDSSFGKKGIVTTDFSGRKDRGYAARRQRDGKFVVVGSANNGSNDDVALARYLANGSLDTSFGNGGKVTTAVGSGHDAAYNVIEQYDGKLLVAGYTQKDGDNFDFLLVRYNANGSLDKSFNSDGKLTTSFGAGQDKALAAVAQSNGQVVLAGFTDSSSKKKVAMARYLFDDDDNDDVLDDNDNCPLISNPEQENHDSDDDGDACDSDDDNDGVKDDDDLFPLDPNEATDNDGDGIGDNADPDDDNDGVPDSEDAFPFDPYLLRRINGSKPDDFLGYSVANAGDVDADAYDDMIVGIPHCDRVLPGKKQPAVNVGCVSVYSGKTGEVLLSFVGSAAGDELGVAVAGGIDMDHDFIPDLVVGAHKADVTDAISGKRLKNAGMVKVYAGADGHELFSISGQAAGDGLGKAVAIMPDADGDGDADILIGAWKADLIDPNTHKKRADAGAAYVYSGRTHLLLKQFAGEGKGDNFGASVAAADVDDDGLSDAMIGAYRQDRLIAANNKKQIDAGAFFVYGAADWALLHKIEGSHAGDQLGFAVAGIPDVNGDGRDDVLVSAPKEDVLKSVTQRMIKDAGTVTVYSGLNANLLNKTQGDIPQNGALFGSSLSTIGDINGDLISDYAVGAFKYDVTIEHVKQANAGRVTLHSGGDATQLFAIDGQHKEGFFGFALNGGGDQNHDGIGDVIIGGHKIDPINSTTHKPILNAGRVEVVSGDAGTPDLPK